MSDEATAPVVSKSKSYYERNKELVKEKALARYYKKIGKEPPKKDAPALSPGLAVSDIKDLIDRLMLLLPVINKKEKESEE